MSPSERRFWKKVHISSDADVCWPWTAGTIESYGRFKHEGRSAVAPRLAYQFASGHNPGELYVCHRCDNPICCNPFHLFVGTALDNHLDCRSKGRHPNARLEEADARRIKFGKEKGADLARAFGVSEMTISHIRKGRSWAWVQPLAEAA